MADDAPVILSLERARRVGAPPLRVVERSPAGRHFEPLPRARFHPADEGAVRLGVVRLGPEIVDELLHLFQSEAAKAKREGDEAAAERIWNLHDDLSAAESGLTPEPPAAA